MDPDGKQNVIALNFKVQISSVVEVIDGNIINIKDIFNASGGGLGHILCFCHGGMGDRNFAYDFLHLSPLLISRGEIREFGVALHTGRAGSRP